MAESLTLNQVHFLYSLKKKPLIVHRKSHNVVAAQRQPMRAPERDYLMESLVDYQMQLAELKHHESPSNPVHFTVRTADGKEVDFKVSPSESIFSLRINIKKVLKIRRRDQKLVLQGNVITGRQSIQQSGITNGSVVHLLEVKDFNKY